MMYLDVEILRETICRVGKWLGYIDRDLDSPEATTLIALVYEQLIRGKVPGGFLICSWNMKRKVKIELEERCLEKESML